MRTQAERLWGLSVDDKDSLFQKALQLNDPSEAETMLRTGGFDRGYERTVRAASDAMDSGMGTNVRGVV
jgi:hypothetical protein